MLQFFKSLFNSNSNTDEKVVVGFFSFAMMCLITVSVMYFKFTIPYEIFGTFAALTFACFGLGTIGTIKTSQIKNDVATEIVKNDSSEESNQVAKEIVQSNKPNQNE